MPDTPHPGPPTLSEVQARLQEAAQILRQSEAIDPQTHRALSDLVGELSKTLNRAHPPAAEVARLAETTATLTEALHQQEKELPVTLRDRVARAALNAEHHAPLASGMALRLLETLANIGI
jgi:hypothetical protein